MSRRLQLILLSVCSCFALLLLPVQAEEPYWRRCGPYGGSIRAMGISSDYGVDESVFAGTESGGLFRSLDGGDSWTSVAGLPRDLTVSSVVVSPDFGDDETLFVSTTQGGVYKSWDGGEVWALWSDGLATFSVADMAISPGYEQDQTLIAATSQGLHVSSSAGKVWDAFGPDVSALCVAIAAADGAYFTAFGGTEVGLYVSTNSGHTWVPTRDFGSPVVAVSVSPGYPRDRTVLVGTLGGAYLSRDGGESWQGPWLEGQTVHHTLFSPRYATDDTLFLGTEDGIQASEDGGDTWTFWQDVPGPVHALVVSPDYATQPVLFAGTEHAGVFRSLDGGGMWEAQNRGMVNVAMKTVALSPNYVQDRNVLAGGPGGVWRSVDDGQTWGLPSLTYAKVNALRCSPYYYLDRMVYAATDGGVFVSRDGGRSWRSISGDLPVLRTLDILLGNGGQLYVATAEDGVYYSTNHGASWHRRADGLQSLHVTSFDWVGGEVGGSRLLAATWGEGVFLSEDGGVSWSPTSTEVATRHARDVASVTGYGGLVWSFAGSTAGLFRSADLGQSWDVAGLMGSDVSTISLHPEYAVQPDVYSGTWSDIFGSQNGGLTWTRLNAGTEMQHVRDLAVTLDDGEEVVLFAATEGGVWRHGGEPETPPPYPDPKRLRLPLIVQVGSLPR